MRKLRHRRTEQKHDSHLDFIWTQPITPRKTWLSLSNTCYDPHPRLQASSPSSVPPTVDLLALHILGPSQVLATRPRSSPRQSKSAVLVPTCCTNTGNHVRCVLDLLRKGCGGAAQLSHHIRQCPGLRLWNRQPHTHTHTYTHTHTVTVEQLSQHLIHNCAFNDPPKVPSSMELL